MSKLINDVDNCVDDSIEGFLCLHHNTHSVIKEHRIVVRKDILDVKKKGQVTLLSGGGAGHEPAHIGFVGEGMLSAVVCGNVFCSPPTSSILAAIRAVGKNNKGGCLLIVTNYTGDRLHFQLAMTKACLEGIYVKMVIIGEDCALTSPDKASGRRGLCGTLLIHKIAGAMAENGRNLGEIVNYVDDITQNFGTIGVSLSSCAPPGSSQTFYIDENHLELGLGIHGEPGVSRLKMMPARDVVSVMFKRMTDKDSASNLKLYSGLTIVLIINNLGGLSELEISIVARECLDYLDKLGVSVARIFCGRLMTSLDMRGVSVTVLHVESETLSYIDQITKAPAWIRACHPVTPGSGVCKTSSLFEEQLIESVILEGIKMSRESAEYFSKAVNSACIAIKNSEKMLNDLDCKGGDGDCGSTLSQGSVAITKLLQESKLDDICQLHKMFLKFGQVIERSMGGTSGALYSIFFTAAASAFCDSSIECKIQDWVNALNYGLKAVMEAGGAQPGDRTMVDPLHAAVEVLSSISTDGTPDTKSIMDVVLENVNKAVMSTKNMKAKAGRASYVSEEKTTGHCDAGAMGIFIIFKAIRTLM